MRYLANSLAAAVLSILWMGGADASSVHAASADKAAPASTAGKKAGDKPASQTSKPTSIKWMPLETAVKNVESSKRYLFVSVYTDWCGYCRKLNTTTYRAAPVIAELGKNFESVKLNAESEAIVMWQGKKLSARALATQWGVEGYPTLLFINRRGEIVGSFSSYVEPDVMVKLLTYISSGAREKKISFNEYLEGKS